MLTVDYELIKSPIELNLDIDDILADYHKNL